MAVVVLCSVASLRVSTMAMLSSRAPAKHATRDEKGHGDNKGGERARHDLGEFIVNLAEPDPQAFVKATIVLEYEGGEKKERGHGAQQTAPSWEAPVRDAVVSTLSQWRRADLRSVAGKDGLKRRILARISKTDDGAMPRFVAVYLTSFAIQ